MSTSNNNSWVESYLDALMRYGLSKGAVADLGPWSLRAGGRTGFAQSSLRLALPSADNPVNAAGVLEGVHAVGEGGRADDPAFDVLLSTRYFVNQVHWFTPLKRNSCAHVNGRMAG